MVKRRKSLGRSYWQHMMEEWKASRLSKVEFCRQHNVALSVFYKWLHRLEKPVLTAQSKPEQITVATQNSAKPEITILNSDFIPVCLNNRKEPERTLSIKAGPVTLELIFASGHRLCVYEAVNWHHLSDLIIPLLKGVLPARVCDSNGANEIK